MNFEPIEEATVWVIIPTFNRCEVLRACLEDLSSQDYPHVRIVVVDDASTDGTAEMLRKQFPLVAWLRGDGNRWWSGAMNLGLGWVMANASSHDYVLSFNDDVLVGKSYLQTLMLASKVAPPDSIIGSMAIDSADANRVVYCGTRIDWQRGLWKGFSVSQLPEGNGLVSTDSLPGRGTLIPLVIFERIGFYDDRRFPQYFGDEDFALRARSAGAQLFVSREAVVRSHVQLTGTGRHSQTFASFFRSLWSIRSPNQLSRRLVFVGKHCPKAFRIQFGVLDILKVATAYWRRRELRS